MFKLDQFLFSKKLIEIARTCVENGDALPIHIIAVETENADLVEKIQSFLKENKINYFQFEELK